MSSNKTPDKSLGGTHYYDKDGKFVKHDPPTKPKEAAKQADDAEPKAAELAAAEAPAPAGKKR